MREFSSYEAKTHLAELLRYAKQGEKVLITKHNTPIAVIIPPPHAKKKSVKEVVNGLKVFRNQISLKGLKIKDLIEEGRK